MAYISGICLLVVVAVCLIAIACVLRRKDRRHAAAMEAEAHAAAEAAQAIAAAEVARRAAHPSVIPVVIVQPDGVLELAEECISKKDELEMTDLESGQYGGGAGPKALSPIGFQLPR